MHIFFIVKDYYAAIKIHTFAETYHNFAVNAPAPSPRGRAEACRQNQKRKHDKT